jgi:hypothetical protein
MTARKPPLLAALFGILLSIGAISANAATVSGQLVKWHPISVDFKGPTFSHTASGPIPFVTTSSSPAVQGAAGRC